MKQDVYSKFEKVVVNVGVGRQSSLPNFDKILPGITKELATITGQKPAERPAKISISGFKLRQGAVIGLKTTLRGKRMTGFLKKVLGVVMPRIRDFRGIRLTSIDESGNLTIGIKDQFVFPELSMENSSVNFGLELTIVPKVVRNREQAVELYRELGVPFEKQTSKKQLAKSNK